MLARFSTVAGERGSADAERDIRGFALKFIDLNHAIKRDPRTNMRSPNTNWDFWSSLPESLLQLTIIMGDRGIPSSFRHMHGFSSNVYSLINKENVA